MEGKDSVFIHYRHNVGSNTHGAEVEQRNEPGERNVVVLGKSLHKLESYTASAEMLEREWIVRTLRIEYGHSRWHHIVRNVMVADDEVYAKTLGVFYLLDSFDAAIQDNDEFYTCFVRKVYSLFAYSIAFVVSVWYVVINVGIKLLQKLVHQCYSRASIHVIVSIDHDALLSSHSIVEAINSDIHILHQEWIDEI